jgi:ribose-phosphate pyrophosphokinase
MNTIVMALPGAEALAASLSARLCCGGHALEIHRYPDGEAGVRLRTSVAGRRVVLAAHLDHPDPKTLPLLFAADAARELGATAVGLVAPYLPYMRQDDRFRPGEAITSRSYARLLSNAFDFLLTVDPHLHRWSNLDAIYGIRTQVVAAAPAVADWLRREVPQPVLVGPDSESGQWVGDVAGRMGAPWFVMRKERFGDRDVRVHLPPGAQSQGRQPVLLDDIASSGGTLAAAGQVLRAEGWGQPIAVVVHALVDAAGLDLLHQAGITRLASCDTVPHPTNAIGVGALLADALATVCAST